MKNYICILFILTAAECFSQNYLSVLGADAGDPVYTVYAAAPEATKYSTDVGYQLVWKDPEDGVVLYSEQSGSVGLIFRQNNVVKSRLGEFSKLPVITTTYSNVFKLFYYPFPEVEVRYTGLVKDSETLILEVEVSNKGSFEKKLDIYPYIRFKDKKLTGVEDISGGLSFSHRRTADGWMKEHNIPFTEQLFDRLITDEPVKGKGTYNILSHPKDEKALVNSLVKSEKLNGEIRDNSIAAMHLTMVLKPGGIEKFRIARTVSAGKGREEKSLNDIFNTDISSYIRKNEEMFRNVPVVKFDNPDEEAVYWNAYNLIHQCMMGPEGKSPYNYYVFSREPKWGWGYGGQVFHESLVMLAYAYFNPAGAMNSQRVYFERQHPTGYINYRTGPYLDEQIPENGQLTSSAPWFNWQNLEIYKITRDKRFLEEAYRSGKRFYEYYTSARDEDKDGLCEWGANAVLESVRDARVAVWDEVGDPVNFESLDCNLMLIKEAKSLGDMAAELGLLDDVSRFRRDAAQRSYLVNRFMWDDSTDFYYNVNKGDHTFTFKKEDDLKRKEIIAFLALWSGVADKDKAAKLVQHLKNKDEFYRNYGVPTLSADDPYYNPIGYWNGPIWVPWQYLVFRGLLDYGYVEEAKDLKDRVIKNISYQLADNNYFWEFYSADDLQAGWNKAYIWTGIISRFLIDLNNLKK